MFFLHVDFEEACGFYNRSNGGVRQKLKTGSQCESVLLRCLTPARLIRMNQITSDEDSSNQLLRLCLRVQQIVYFLSLKLDRERDPRLAPVQLLSQL